MEPTTPIAQRGAVDIGRAGPGGSAQGAQRQKTVRGGHDDLLVRGEGTQQLLADRPTRHPAGHGRVANIAGTSPRSRAAAGH